MTGGLQAALGGISGILVTPFDSNDDIAPKLLAPIIDRALAAGLYVPVVNDIGLRSIDHLGRRAGGGLGTGTLCRRCARLHLGPHQYLAGTVAGDPCSTRGGRLCGCESAHRGYCRLRGGSGDGNERHRRQDCAGSDGQRLRADETASCMAAGARATRQVDGLPCRKRSGRALKSAANWNISVDIHQFGIAVGKRRQIIGISDR